MYLRTCMSMLFWNAYTVQEIGRILAIYHRTVRHRNKKVYKKGLDGLYDEEKTVSQLQCIEDKAKLHITSPDDQYEVKKNGLKTSKQIIRQTRLSSMRMNVVL